jgi:ankyrin repeat protein
MAKKSSGARGPDDRLVDACREGNVERVNRALADGANLELDSAGGRQRPLFLAASHGHAHLFQFLLGRGADVLKATSAGVTPLFEAAGHDYVGIVEMCLDAGDSVESGNASGQTPLMVAVAGGAVRTVKLLLARGASPDAMPTAGPTIAGTTAIHFAGGMRQGK